MKYKKILIFGLTASGKTTFAKKLSKILKIKVYHTDDFAYKKKWTVKSTEEEFMKKKKKVEEKDKWIIEGVHSEWVYSSVKKADLVIFLHTKKSTMARRALKRSRLSKKKDTFKQKLKLIYWVYRWNVTWYRKCRNFSKEFIELRTKKDYSDFFERIKSEKIS